MEKEKSVSEINHLVVFKQKNIRRVLHNNEWWFSIIDVIEALTGTNRSRKYWSDLKSKLIKNEGFNELSDKIGQLKLKASDGKEYATDCANTETLFRIMKGNYLPEKTTSKRLKGG